MPTSPATSRAAIALALVLGAAGARAAEKTGDPRLDEAYPLRLEVGKSVKVCETGTLMCPAEAPICDDPKIATWSFGPDGLEFEGVSPGQTFCSAGSALKLRRVYRVTVAARAAAP